jgi:hypothetical protein
MTRIYPNSDIKFDINTIKNIGDYFAIKFYTVNPSFCVSKTDQDITDEHFIKLNWSELEPLGQGVLQYIVNKSRQDEDFDDQTFDSSFSRTTNYFICSDIEGRNQEMINLIERNMTSIDIPYGTTKIGLYALSFCGDLTRVTIPNSVTSIDDNAFRSCTKLTNITIPNSVTSIGYSALHNCIRLASVTVEAATPPTLGGNAFALASSSLAIYVPAESVETYKKATNWSSYADRIQPIPTE